MLLLKENFYIFTYYGCWLPGNFKSSKCKTVLYKLYRLLILSNVLAIVLLTIINVSRGFGSIEEYASVMLGVTDFICAVIKSISLHNRRRELYDIEKTFLKCQRENNSSGEVKIQAVFDTTCRFDFIYFCKKYISIVHAMHEKMKIIRAVPDFIKLFLPLIRILACGFYVSALVTMILVGLNSLASRTCDLFSVGILDISSQRAFWIAFAHQVITVNVIAALTMNFDTFIAGYLLQICAQIEILKYKLMKISMLQSELQYQAIVHCVIHHDRIYR